MTKKIIDKFDEEYDFLSNFYNCYIKYKGLTYSNSEAAFQAQKCKTEEDKIPFTTMIAGKAKRAGRKVDLREDWESIKLQEMENIVRIKFNNNAILKRRLLETGDAILIEGNYWHDIFWGVCEGVGDNHLGKILMKIREEFKDTDTGECVSIMSKESQDVYINNIYKLSLMKRSPNNTDASKPELLYARKINTVYRHCYRINVGESAYVFLEKENPFPITRHSNIYTMESINTPDSIYFTDLNLMKQMVINKQVAYIDFHNKEWSDELSAKCFDL